MRYDKDRNEFVNEELISLRDLKRYACNNRKQLGYKVENIPLTKDELLFGNFCTSIIHILNFKYNAGYSWKDLPNADPNIVKKALNEYLVELSNDVSALVEYDKYGKDTICFFYPERIPSRGHKLKRVFYDESVIEFVLALMGYKFKGELSDRDFNRFALGRFGFYTDCVETPKDFVFFLEEREPTSINEIKENIKLKLSGPKK